MCQAVRIGAALNTERGSVDAFFGKFEPISGFTFVIGVLTVALIVSFIFRYKSALILTCFRLSWRLLLASTQFVESRFSACLSLTVLIGLRFMGALLAGALIIIPAAPAGAWPTVSVSSCSHLARSLLAVGLGFLVNTYVLRASASRPRLSCFSSHFLPELDQAEGLARESALVQSGRKA